jgi:hypothetical protein
LPARGRAAASERGTPAHVKRYAHVKPYEAKNHRDARGRRLFGLEADGPETGTSAQPAGDRHADRRQGRADILAAAKDAGVPMDDGR